MSVLDSWNTMERLAQLDSMRQLRETNRVMDDLRVAPMRHADYISQSMKDLMEVARATTMSTDYLVRQSAMELIPKHPSWSDFGFVSEAMRAWEMPGDLGVVKGAALQFQVDQVLRACDLFEAQVGKAYSQLLSLDPYPHLAATLSMLRDGILTRASSVLTARDNYGLLTLVRAWDVSPPDLLHLRLNDRSDPEPEVPSEEVIEVRCNIVCRFCGSLLISESRSFSVDSGGYLHSEMAVIPLCTDCERAQWEDPDYLERCLADLERERRPRLILIRGGGQTSARHPVAFRVVRQEPEQNPEEE